MPAAFSAVVDAATRARWWLAVAAAAALALTLHPDIAADQQLFARSGQAIVSGHWNAAYVNPAVQSGPLQLVWSWLVTAVARAVTPSKVDAAAVNAALAVSLATVLPMLMVRHLVSVPVARRARMELLTGTLVLATGAALFSATWGHPAQLMVPLAWGAALAAARSGRATLAGALVGVAAGWETWGLLGLAVLVVVRRPRAMARGAVAAVAVTALLFGPFVLTGSFAMGSFSWPIDHRSIVASLFPAASQATWQMRLLQAVLTEALCVPLLLRCRDGRRLLWAGPMGLVLVRLFLDPLSYPYYWQPVLVLAVLGAVETAHEAGRTRLLVAGIGYLAVTGRILGPWYSLAAMLGLLGWCLGADRWVDHLSRRTLPVRGLNCHSATTDIPGVVRAVRS